MLTSVYSVTNTIGHHHGIFCDHFDTGYKCSDLLTYLLKDVVLQATILLDCSPPVFCYHNIVLVQLLSPYIIINVVNIL